MYHSSMRFCSIMCGKQHTKRATWPTRSTRLIMPTIPTRPTWPTWPIRPTRPTKWVMWIRIVFGNKFSTRLHWIVDTFIRQIGPTPPSMHFDVSSLRSYRFCVGQCRNFALCPSDSLHLSLESDSGYSYLNCDPIRGVHPFLTLVFHP